MSKYIIVGPGASGKDYLQKKMIDLGYHPMKQYTTREIRENETGNECSRENQESGPGI